MKMELIMRGSILALLSSNITHFLHASDENGKTERLTHKLYCIQYVALCIQSSTHLLGSTNL